MSIYNSHVQSTHLKQGFLSLQTFFEKNLQTFFEKIFKLSLKKYFEVFELRIYCTAEGS